MFELPPEKAPARRRALAADGRTFAVVMGGAGLGLLGGLCYGAWIASRAPGGNELVTMAAWAISLVFYGAMGFVGGLAAGLLVMVMTWIVRLAKHLAKGLEE